MASKAEEFSLPMACINRIIKESLPDGTIVSKEAKLALMKATCVFILYSTSVSNEFASKAHRRTLNAEDMFQALEDMELNEFIPDLREMLETNKSSKAKKQTSSRKSKYSEMDPDGDPIESGEVEVMEVEERLQSDDIFSEEPVSGAMGMDNSQKF
ncbi:DNA polymerase epsilon subunit 3 [Oopsacas minuta]|uniref:DNA polymerase epsilon subunit 3 n=1 Tax=Oopsacas minuta TaxID=111878 RepID=A0AAV7K4F9_9METZ|nr:DNA polymerase epsilon subunit 3 [Oopsacas minuta]